MNTKEAAALWNISQRRITMLAAQGRIPGARLIGNCWMIPSDAEKPADNRGKAEKHKKTKKADRFIFPDILYYISNECPVESLNAEEKRLYDAAMCYETGNFEEGVRIANALLSETENIYIRIGAYAQLSFLYIFLRQFQKAAAALLSFWNTFSEAEDYSAEMMLMKFNMAFCFDDKKWLTKEIPIDPACNYSKFVLGMIANLSLVGEAVTSEPGKNKDNLTQYKIISLFLEKDGFFYLSIFSNYLLSFLSGINGDVESERFYMKKAIDIAFQHQIVTSLCGFTHYCPNLFCEVLEDYPEEIRKKYIDSMKISLPIYSEFLVFLSGNPVLSELTIEDYNLISDIMKDYKIEKIATDRGISLSKAKKKLVSLYKKFNVGSKRELIERYLSLLITPETQLPK